MIASRNYSFYVFFGCSKLFDLLDYKLLLDKMYSIGVTGVVCDWFRSYSAGRQHLIKYRLWKAIDLVTLFV